MQKWEYKHLYVYQEKDKWVFEYEEKKYLEGDRLKVMNVMGQQGWELVCSLPFENSVGAYQPATYTSGYILFFKRAIA